jgi:hypothetical protein
MRRGAIIGLVSGLLTGPTMLIWLFIYSVVWPNPLLGSTAVLGPVLGAVQSTIFGVIVGGTAGAIAVWLGAKLVGMRRCAAFGAILMAACGALMSLGDAAWTPLTVGLDLLSPILAGIAAGALVATLNKGQ